MPGISVSKICVPFGGGGIDWSSYWTNRHPELATYIDGLTTPLSTAQIRRLGEFIEAVKTGLSITNLSDAFDVMYVLAGETAESSLRNLVKNAHYATAVNSPAFMQYEGFTGNGTSSYIQTNYIPNSDNVNYILNDGSRYAYLRSVDNTNVVIDGDADDNGYTGTLRIGNSVLVGFIHQGVGALSMAVNVSGVGMKSIHRTSNTNVIIYNNKTANNRTGASTKLERDQYYILKSLASFGGHQVSFYAIAKALTSYNDSIVDAFEAYMDANGKGVIA